MGIAEARALGGDDQVAAQYGFQAAGQGQAVDGGDDRLGEHPQGIEEGDDSVEQVFLAWQRGATGLEVGTGAERRAGGGQHHHADLVVVFPGVQAGGHGLQHFTVQGIHGLRPGQGDPTHLALDFKRNGLAHLQSSITLQLTFLSELELTRVPQGLTPPLADGGAHPGVCCRMRATSRQHCHGRRL
ncbi:hypothetical protein D3C78_1038160 [compost metagenome]